MSTRGDSQFPATSLSANGHHSKIHRTPSHEALAAHPLLSPGPSSASASSTSSSPETTRVAPPKYLPYTPRHRPPTGTVTTGTTGTIVSSPLSISPQQYQGSASATSKLQLQNLKAAVQNLGLDSGSLGWAMLEELVSGADHNPTWNEIWSMVTVGKATLLLPLEQQSSSNEAISPEFFRDHIVFCNGSARGDAPLITMSGFRGSINDKLTIRSAIPATSKTYSQLTNASTRATALKSLPPLPTPLSPQNSFPEFTLAAYSESLPLPPRSGLPPKPPLPPRPGTKAPAPQPASRLANPFASFFSKPSTPSSSPSPLPVDPLPSDHVVEISAFIIDTPIVRRTVVKSLAKAIKSETKEYLGSVPSWVVDRVQTFSANMLPFPKKQRSTREGTAVDKIAPAYSVAAYEELPSELEDAFQAFYEAMEEELKVDGSPTTLRRRDDKPSDDESGRAKDKDHDDKVNNVLERVERTLCTVFYDRLFKPSNSDDAQHDEALSSHIAALNMLDVTLDHLGVDVGLVGVDVDSVVRACGETISQLEVACCPADKAAILVAAHNIIVDGLSRLPPLRLKSDDQGTTDLPPEAPESLNKNPVDGAAHDVSTATENSSNITAPPVDANASVTISEDSSGATLPLPEPAIPDTPLLTVSPPKTPTPVSGDILLPLIIFSVVKANPSQLVSHLLYTQRYRNKTVGGEESYCLINLMAVVEFLENVDLGVLGLKDSESKVLSTADLTPIPLAQAALNTEATQGPGAAHAGLRGKVEQQVDAIAGSANKVISGVVDSSFGVLRSLLPVNVDQNAQSADGTAETAPWNNIRPGFGLLRRESGFSIASLAASLPRARERSRSVLSHANDEEGQEMVESRPSSIRDVRLGDGLSDDESDGSSVEDSDTDDGVAHDTKSIRSFESMMSFGKKKGDKKERPSITDRLAHMSRLTRSSGVNNPQIEHMHGSPPPRSSSLLATSHPNNRFDTPLSSRAPSPVPEIVKPKISPPIRRFMECSFDDLKISEIPELLQEYRRLVDQVRAMGVFDTSS